MTKYRGFMNEVVIPQVSLDGLGVGFRGPYVKPLPPPPAPVVAPTVYVRPPVIRVPITQIPGAVGIPGDIRPITARILPGEAIVDDMAAETGIPGVDETGMFPYGDPRATKNAAAKEKSNFVPLAIATAIAFAIFGG